MADVVRDGFVEILKTIREDFVSKRKRITQLPVNDYHDGIADGLFAAIDTLDMLIEGL